MRDHDDARVRLVVSEEAAARKRAPASMGRASVRRNPVLMHRPWHTKPRRSGVNNALASRRLFIRPA
jgi:hypothetical protein